MYHGTCGTCTIGCQAPSLTWYLSEGSTDWGFEEFVCVQNPTPSNGVVQARYMLSNGGGQIISVPFTLPAYSRATINVADVVPGADVAVRVLRATPGSPAPPPAAPRVPISTQCG